MIILFLVISCTNYNFYNKGDDFSINSQKLIYNAIKAQDLNFLRFSLDDGDIDEKIKGKTPLELAFESSNKDIIKCVLFRIFKDEYILDQHLKLLESKRFNNSKAINKIVDEAITLIQMKRASKNKNILLNLNDKSKRYNEKTGIMLSAEYGAIDLVKLFLETKVNLNDTFSTKDINEDEKRNDTLFDEFKNDKNFTDSTKVLVSKTPLMLACENGHLNVVKLLIENGADVNAIGYLLETPLISAIRGQHINIIEYLLERGADINIRSFLYTPLAMACNINNLDIVKLLIDKKVKINDFVTFNFSERIKFYFQGLPLIICAKNGYKEILEILISNGVCINSEREIDIEDIKIYNNKELSEINKNKWLTFSKDRAKDIGKFITYKGSSCEAIISIASEKAIESFYRVESPASRYKLEALNKIHILDPVRIAVENNRIEVLKLLINSGVDIRKKYLEDKTLTIIAVEKSNKDILELLLEECDPNEKDNKGKTLLMLAAEKGEVGILEVLLEKKADINVKCNSGMNALFYAEKANQEDVKNFLLLKGIDYGNGECTIS